MNMKYIELKKYLKKQGVSAAEVALHASVCVCIYVYVYT